MYMRINTIPPIWLTPPFVRKRQRIVGTLLVKPVSSLSLTQLYYVEWAMNSRGAAELVIALIALQFALIPVEIFSVLVAMAMITTLTFPFVLAHGIKKNPTMMDEKTPST